jgi:hypothetical protein
MNLWTQWYCLTKNQRSKISWDCPFKFICVYLQGPYSFCNISLEVMIVNSYSYYHADYILYVALVTNAKYHCCLVNSHIPTVRGVIKTKPEIAYYRHTIIVREVKICRPSWGWQKFTAKNGDINSQWRRRHQFWWISHYPYSLHSFLIFGPGKPFMRSQLAYGDTRKHVEAR